MNSKIAREWFSKNAPGIEVTETMVICFEIGWHTGYEQGFEIGTKAEQNINILQKRFDMLNDVFGKP